MRHDTLFKSAVNWLDAYLVLLRNPKPETNDDAFLVETLLLFLRCFESVLLYPLVADSLCYATISRRLLEVPLASMVHSTTYI